MSDVLGALPPLAPGVRSYDRPLKKRDEEGKYQETGVRLIQLHKPDAPYGKRLATLFIPPECPDTPQQMAAKLIARCREYRYFQEAKQ